MTDPFTGNPDDNPRSFPNAQAGSPPDQHPDIRRGAAVAQTLRRQVHHTLESGLEHDGFGRWLSYGLIVLIIANAIAFAVETVPELGARYEQTFELFNLISIAIFTLEYAARIWSSVELPFLQRMSPARARLKFALRPLQVIDLLAVLPFYLGALVSLDLRILRVLRLIRLLKLLRYSPALHALGRVIANERRALVGALMVMMSLLLFAATGIYFIERDVQPGAFGSIPKAAWWALATLTTVGYGDVIPATALGKMFGGLVMIFGLGMFALPIAIIATGFAQENNRRDFVVNWSLVARVPVFRHLDAAQVAEIMALLYARTYVQGANIFHSGEPANEMYFIASGAVVVHTDNGPRELGEGEFFGEMALLDNREHANSVSAITKCRLLLLDRDDFLRLCQRNPEIGDSIRATSLKRAGADAAGPTDAAD